MADSSATNPDAQMTEAVAVASAGQATDPTSFSADKGKGKSVEAPADVSMETDEDDEEDDEDEEEEDDDDEAEEDLDEIDPSVIIPSDGGRPRRSRPQVDYSSAEAMAKAGIDPTKPDEDD